MSTIKLIIGLGNPGPNYIDTRHNAGAWFVEQIAASEQTPLKAEAKYHGLFAKVTIANQTVYLLNPTTFMNRSGTAVQAICQFYKIAPEEILVAHDELDFDAGVARIKVAGGHGGHNGLRDIIQKLGGAKDFNRLRIGIGHPGDKSKVHNYVLKNPSSTDKQKIVDSIHEAQRYLESIVTGDIAKAMNALHTQETP
jgi:PTH1 family peptidyl-tRNA hydrolase